ANTLTTNSEVDWSQWSDLFHDFDAKKQPHIELSGDSEQTRSLHISYDPSDRIQTVSQGASHAFVQVLPVKFTYTDARSRSRDVRPVQVAPPENIGYVNVEPTPVEVVMFAAQINLNYNEIVERFSNLVRTRRDANIRNTITSEFEF